MPRSFILPKAKPESIEFCIENQAVSTSYDLAPPSHPPLSPRQQGVSISQSLCVSPVELVHKIEILFGFDSEMCIIFLLVMSKY